MANDKLIDWRSLIGQTMKVVIEQPRTGTGRIGEPPKIQEMSIIEHKLTVPPNFASNRPDIVIVDSLANVDMSSLERRAVSFLQADGIVVEGSRRAGMSDAGTTTTGRTPEALTVEHLRAIERSIFGASSSARQASNALERLARQLGLPLDVLQGTRTGRIAAQQFYDVPTYEDRLNQVVENVDRTFRRFSSNLLPKDMEPFFCASLNPSFMHMKLIGRAQLNMQPRQEKRKRGRINKKQKWLNRDRF